MSLERVDHNLQVIRQIEGAWSLPKLPDDVVLDLAGNTIMDTPAIAGLLTGIEAQIEEAGRRQPFPTRDDLGVTDVVPARPTYASSSQVDVGRTVISVAGFDPPRVFDNAAVPRLKQALVNEGYLDLDPAEIASPRWLPEYSYAAAQRSYDQISARFQGNKPGSVSVEQIFDIVDDWLSPRGLYRAAVELDLWWDGGQIRSEFQQWDDKLREWREDPWNPRKLIDVATGPLDDLLFPALNLALMFTGIGELIGVGRVALTGGLKGAQAVAGLYRGSKGLRFLDEAAMAADVARLQSPSFLAGKVAQMGPAGAKTAQAMAGWRKLKTVTIAKKANQLALKAGFTSKVEQLVDADRGGQSISHFTGGELGSQVHQLFSNPMLDWGVDLLLFPPNIFAPGRFSGPARKAADKIRQGFVDMSENRELTMAFHQPVVKFLGETDGPETVKRFEQAVSEKGLQQALADQFFGGNREQMGAAMGFTTVMAAIDHGARRSASVMVGQLTNELDSGTHTLFHQYRNTMRGQLTKLDPNDIESLVNHGTKFGFGDEIVRSARDFEKRRAKMLNGYLESVEEMRARNGRTPDGHTRYVGSLDPETGVIKWQPTHEVKVTRRRPDVPATYSARYKVPPSVKAQQSPLGMTTPSDPDILILQPDRTYVVDIPDEELRQVMGDAAQDIIDGEVPLPDVFANRYRRRGKDGPRYPTVAELKESRVFKPEKIQTLKELAQRHNDLRAERLAELLNDLTPDALSQYVYEVLPTFGNWPKFLDATGEINHALMRGDLDNVRFAEALSDQGRRVAAMPVSPTGDKWVDEIFLMLAELPDDPPLFQKLMKSVFSPFARDVDPVTGRFTAALKDTVTKQEALTFATTAKRHVRLIEGIRKVKANPKLTEAFANVAGVAAESGKPTKDVVREILAEALGGAGSEDTVRLIRTLSDYIEDSGTTLDDIERLLTRRLSEINVLPDWSERYMVPTNFHAAGDVVEQVRAKVKEVQRQANFLASEVADAPEDLVEFLDAHGYKLVYGVDFAQPFDMDDIMPEFADVARRHIRGSRFGDFFSRQDPEMLSRLKARKVKESLFAELRGVDHTDGLPLNLSLDPMNADMDALMSDLWDILHDVQNSARQRLDDIEDARFFEKLSTRASLARIPFSLDRLGSDLGFRKFVSLVMAKGYSREQARAIYRALQKSQALGFRTHGLFAIETKLRSEPNLIEGLRAFGTIQASDRFRGVRPIRATTGAIGGAAAANYAASEYGGEEDVGLHTLAGMAIGGALGAAPRIGIPGVRKLVSNLEHSDFLRYAYLADHLANFRDYVRFSLSPIFDASRYSEGIILGQLGYVPEGLKSMRVNQSPTAFRKMLAKEFRSGGADPDTARRLARDEWDRIRDMFAASARGYRDFDWEMIDGVGRRFSSIGVLGFSPTDWMASTFGHLVRDGVEPKKAYEVVRDIYTYGTTGRSAAELSMNFVFFPFSFTKKTVGHLTKFFSDDLTRMVVLHDMVATYQMLDEHYDLSQEWRDRLPILQRAHRLNLLAYGIGLGRFGGVNAPMIEAVGRMPGFDSVMEYLPGAPEIANMFIPQMVPMNTPEDGNNAWEALRGMVPAFNDVNTMLQALGEQGQVVFSETHMTARAENRRAWEEWREYQDEIKPVLEAAGMTWAQAVRRPEINAFIQSKRTEISRKYPGWKFEMGDGIAHAQAIEMELRERLQYPESPADLMLAEFDELVNLANERFVQSEVGSLNSSPELLPPEFFDLIRRVAVGFARQDPEFARLYDRFYRRMLGDITTQL